MDWQVDELESLVGCRYCLKYDQNHPGITVTAHMPIHLSQLVAPTLLPNQDV